MSSQRVDHCGHQLDSLLLFNDLVAATMMAPSAKICDPLKLLNWVLLYRRFSAEAGGHTLPVAVSDPM